MNILMCEIVLSCFRMQIIDDKFSSTGHHLPALPVGGAPPGSGGRGAAVVGDRSVVLGRHGGPHVPDACANHVWKAVL